MPESTEPSTTQPLVREAQSESANAVHSENENSSPQNVVPPNFVEIYQILKPDVSPGEEKEEEETEDAVDEEISPDQEQVTVEPIPHELEQKTTEKKPLPSEKIAEALREAGNRRDMNEASKLAYEYSAQRAVEEKAAKQAQDRAAEEQRAAREDSAEQEEEEYFDDDEPSEPEPPPEPEFQFGVKIGGRPGKTAGRIKIKDLLRVDGAIEEFRFSSPEDGVINLFPEPRTFVPLRRDFPTLYESLILPRHVKSFRTTRELFDEIVALLQKHVMLPRKECSLLAYWAIATWFTDYLPFLPNVVISGPASTADLLLRTLAAVCRRPILLGELSPLILRKLPIAYIEPTLLIRAVQLNRYTSALLNASAQPGYLFFDGESLEQFYCPKCIYVGELVKDSLATSNSIQINLGGSVLQSSGPPPTKDEMTHFHNRLLGYRLLNHDKVKSANFHVSGFRPEISVAADVLGAAIVDDVDLQRGVIDVLKDRDEQSRVDRATGVNGLVLRAVLFHCHQKEERKYVREIAATANRFYAEDGELLRVSSETVGHALKYLGLYSCRLGNAGRGLVFDKATQAHAHRLSHAHDVLTSEPSCEHCHGLQQSESQEVVQDV
ncbi:MAG: hypothetical protein WCC32_14275 [Terriglobales bacterium]